MNWCRRGECEIVITHLHQITWEAPSAQEHVGDSVQSPLMQTASTQDIKVDRLIADNEIISLEGLPDMRLGLARLVMPRAPVFSMGVPGVDRR